ncbi:MAG TPA: phage terminase large subunit [Cytophagaceae bacterium]|jgi:predicted phage terminase large subunit-like protein|nr:phage terminase large subunit [Cytophagaceae bacterium]
MKQIYTVSELYEKLFEGLRTDLRTFIKYSFKYLRPGDKFLDNWHIDAISEYLMACKNREIKRLIINMPPRTMKSLTTSVAFPAWLMGNKPSDSIVGASYTQNLSNQHSLDCRAIMESEWFKVTFPECRFTKDQNQKSEYMTTLFGKRFATSVGGSLTGKGGQYIIIDDPLDPTRAASDVERETANNWMCNTVPSRLNNQENDVIIVNMQRLHEDDVTGNLLQKKGWELLCLPAKNDRRTVIQMGNFKKIFEKDELLHPARLSEKVLLALENSMGSFEYAGQFLQQPVPKAGGILRAKWWTEWENTKALPSCFYTIQVYDTAYKIGEENDYTARTTWGIFYHNNDNPNIILLEAMNKRLTFPELRAEVVESYYDFDPDIVLIEDKVSGISLIQELKKLGIRLKAMARGKGDDKVSRAHVASVMLEQGVVWYPKGCAWATEVIRQCASFPNAKHDDLTDTVTDALIFLRNFKRITVPNDGVASTGSSTFKPQYGGHYG